MQENPEITELPTFVQGKILYETPQHQYRVVMDVKLGTNDPRFFIEPLTDDAEQMLRLAAQKHNIQEYQFNVRETPNRESTKFRLSIRADFSKENLPSLFDGYVDIPEADKDSMPSPDRMEECLLKHPQEYTFED